MSQLKLRKMKASRWQALTDESDRERAKLLGWSPGGAAAELGVTRQAIHYAIRRGDLEAVMVTDDATGQLQMFMIPDASLQDYKRKREARLNWRSA